MKVLDVLKAKRRQFFWGGSSENRKMSWVAWNRIIAKKEDGGLGWRGIFRSYRSGDGDSGMRKIVYGED